MTTDFDDPNRLDQGVVADSTAQFPSAVGSAKWFECFKQQIAPATRAWYGRFYVGSDDHPHFRAPNGADYDLTAAGTYLEQVTNRIYVDGGRTDSYVEVGSIIRPFKTIQAGVNACPPGGCVCIASATYVENVVMVGRIAIDADPGTLLRCPTGTALTVTDDALPPPTGVPMFFRGLFLQSEDPGGWCLHVKSTGSWQPFVVLLDQGCNSRNGSGCIWCEGGGAYLTDAGGTDGEPAVCIRCGSSGTTVGGLILTGKHNLNCGAGGKLFELHENSFVLADGASLDGGGMGPSDVVVELNGRDTPGTGINFQMRYGSIGEGSFNSCVRSTGQNVNVDIACQFHGTWGSFVNDVFDMPEGGNLRLNEGGFSSQTGRVLRFGRNLPAPSNGNLDLGGVALTGRAAWVSEIKGNVSGQMYDCRQVNDNAMASGAFQLDANAGGMALIDGIVQSAGGVCVDLQASGLYLLGGIDIIPGGGATPLNVALGATVFRGHCNIRSGTPVIAGTEVLLNSTFGMIDIGPTGQQIRVGSGTGLPAGGAGYRAGSLFMLIPVGPGLPVLHQNIGTEAVPVWVQGSFDAFEAVPGTVWAAIPGLPTNTKDAIDRIANALATHLGVPIP